MSETCVVVGGAGFIGSHLVDALLESGRRVVAIDDFSTGRHVNLADAENNPWFSLAEMDIALPEARRLVEQAAPTTLYILAAQSSVRVSMRDPLLDVRTNILGLVNMLEAARVTGSRVVFATSGGTIYGDVPDQDQPIRESYPRAPISIYGVAKAAAIDYLRVYGEQFGVPWCALALGNVYGPRQPGDGEAGVVAIYCHRIAQGRPLEVFGDGCTTRDFVHVSDVVDAFVRAGNYGASGVFNIGTGVGTSVTEVVRNFQSILSDAIDVVYRPALPGEVRSVALDSSRAYEEFGWQPKGSLHAGIRELVERM